MLVWLKPLKWDKKMKKVQQNGKPELTLEETIVGVNKYKPTEKQDINVLSVIMRR